MRVRQRDTLEMREGETVLGLVEEIAGKFKPPNHAQRCAEKCPKAWLAETGGRVFVILCDKAKGAGKDGGIAS